MRNLLKIGLLFLASLAKAKMEETDSIGAWVASTVGTRNGVSFTVCAIQDADCSHRVPCCSGQSVPLQCVGGTCRSAPPPRPVSRPPPPVSRPPPPVSRPPALRPPGSGPAVTYQPGKLTTPAYDKYGRMVLLSEGLAGRAIAYSGEPVEFANGSRSRYYFHQHPDGAGVFAKNPQSPTTDGFYYTSNSEVGYGRGGVYSIEFNQNGDVVDYYEVLSGTSLNCGGGNTPWGSWVSNEENGSTGRAWQTDPSGRIRPRRTNLVPDGGQYESFAFDNFQYPNRPLTFYTTEDQNYMYGGELVRFTPNAAGLACYAQSNPADRWCTLENGTHSYLRLNPRGNGDFGTFQFVQNKWEANPIEYYNAEGIDSRDGILYFVSKAKQAMFRLDLDRGTYSRTSTYSGSFNLEPDQLKILPNVSDIIYFCEDGGRNCDVHGRDGTGKYYTILQGSGYNSETTGLNFTPDGRFMFVAFQYPGVVWQFWRQDGFSFHGNVLDVKYHAAS